MRFADLLDVQFWLMGRDVEHPDGNLLCSALSFTRERAPKRSWPSRYRRTTNELDVLIWRCGLLLDRGGDGLLLVRGLAPVAVDPADLGNVFDPEKVFASWSTSAVCPTHRLPEASLWFADYEAAVSASAGVAHRVPVAGTRPALAPAEPCSLEQDWRALATDLSGLSGLRDPSGLSHQRRRSRTTPSSRVAGSPSGPIASR